MRKPIIFREDSQNGNISACCPYCNETLEVADLEAFFACPFCGGHLEDNDELQTFLMTPSVNNWVAKTMKNIIESN